MSSDASERTWTIGSLVKWATDDFRTRGIENPRLDAEVLVGHALGLDRTGVILSSMRPLEGAELTQLRALVKRRRTHEPIAYLRGHREFYGREFLVDARVLIPRPDTEALIDVALERTNHVSLSTRILDLCTGSGCVAVTLARQRPTARVVATDISEDALTVARENAYRLGAYNVAFRHGDLFAALEGASRLLSTTFDLVTANPPYIPSGDIPGLMPDVRDFEPRVALDGGTDGLDLVRRIVETAPRYLDVDGVLAMEIGAGEAADTQAILSSAGFRDVAVARDYGRIERVVSGIRPARIE